LRRGILGVNLKEFTSIADIDDFCRSRSSISRSSDGKGVVEEEEEEAATCNAKRNYVKDYLWGFNKEADDRGYYKFDAAAAAVDGIHNNDIHNNNNSPAPVPTTTTTTTPDDDHRFFFYGMWIPGNGVNHNETPNTVYKATPDGINLVALVDIKADDELFDDYRRHGTSSPWLKEFARIHNVTLNFADCNDFV